MTKSVSPIRGKVAQVLNSREVALNKGQLDGVEVGMIFRILSLKGSEITDPDTGDLLGSVELEKSRVKVTTVYERVSVAETYRTHKVNVGGRGLGGAALANLLAPPRWETRVDTFEIDDDTKVELDEEEAYVKRGDPVIQYIDAPPPTPTPTPTAPPDKPFPYPP